MYGCRRIFFVFLKLYNDFNTENNNISTVQQRHPLTSLKLLLYSKVKVKYTVNGCIRRKRKSSCGYMYMNIRNHRVLAGVCEVTSCVKLFGTKKEVVEVNGVKTEYNQLVAEIDEGCLYSIAKDVLKKAKDDKTIIKIVSILLMNFFKNTNLLIFKRKMETLNIVLLEIF